MIAVINLYQYRKAMADKVSDIMDSFGLLKGKSYPISQVGIQKMHLDSITDPISTGFSAIIYIVLTMMLIDGKITLYWVYSYLLCMVVRTTTKELVHKGYI